jgi:hypothetical protein
MTTRAVVSYLGILFNFAASSSTTVASLAMISGPESIVRG